MNNREIDRLVAEKVMGCTVREVCTSLRDGQQLYNLYCECGHGEHGDLEPDQDRRISSDPWSLNAYSTEIAAAWQVVEKLNTQRFWIIINTSHYPNKSKKVMIGSGLWDTVTEFYADTVPMAICLAALKAAGVEIEVKE